MEQSANGNIRRSLGRSALWLLVEFPEGHSNRYEVMSSTEIRTSIHSEVADPSVIRPGITVFVIRENVVISVLIKALSDDRELVQTELDIKNASKQRLNSDAVSSVGTQFNDILESNGVLTGPIIRRQSNSQRRSPSGSHRHVSNNASVIRSNPSVHQPMTFDQQTQADFKGPAMTLREAQLQAAIEQYSELRREQENLFNIEEQVMDLNDEMSELKTMVAQLNELMNQRHNNNLENSESDDYIRNNSVTFNSTAVPAQPSQPPRILNLSQQSSNLRYNSLVIEPIRETSSDSYYSYQSRLSMHASSQSLFTGPTMPQTVSPNVSNGQIDHSERKYFDLSGGPPSSNTSGSGPNHTSSHQMHSDDIGNPNEEVVLGRNNTTVPRSLLMKINWNSHKNATRKLLRAKFSREVLASHSLTGKPSPGMFSKQLINSLIYCLRAVHLH